MVPPGLIPNDYPNKIRTAEEGTGGVCIAETWLQLAFMSISMAGLNTAIGRETHGSFWAASMFLSRTMHPAVIQLFEQSLFNGLNFAEGSPVMRLFGRQVAIMTRKPETLEALGDLKWTDSADDEQRRKQFYVQSMIKDDPSTLPGQRTGEYTRLDEWLDDFDLELDKVDEKKRGTFAVNFVIRTLPMFRPPRHIPGMRKLDVLHSSWDTLQAECRGVLAVLVVNYTRPSGMTVRDETIVALRRIMKAAESAVRTESSGGVMPDSQEALKDIPNQMELMRKVVMRYLKSWQRTAAVSGFIEEKEHTTEELLRSFMPEPAAGTTREQLWNAGGPELAKLLLELVSAITMLVSFVVWLNLAEPVNDTREIFVRRRPPKPLLRGKPTLGNVDDVDLYLDKEPELAPASYMGDAQEPVPLDLDPEVIDVADRLGNVVVFRDPDREPRCIRAPDNPPEAAEAPAPMFHEEKGGGGGAGEEEEQMPALEPFSQLPNAGLLEMQVEAQAPAAAMPVEATGAGDGKEAKVTLTPKDRAVVQLVGALRRMFHRYGGKRSLWDAIANEEKLKDKYEHTTIMLGYLSQFLKTPQSAAVNQHVAAVVNKFKLRRPDAQQGPDLGLLDREIDNMFTLLAQGQPERGIPWLLTARLDTAEKLSFKSAVDVHEGAFQQLPGEWEETSPYWDGVVVRFLLKQLREPEKALDKAADKAKSRYNVSAESQWVKLEELLACQLIVTLAPESKQSFTEALKAKLQQRLDKVGAELVRDFENTKARATRDRRHPVNAAEVVGFIGAMVFKGTEQQFAGAWEANTIWLRKRLQSQMTDAQADFTDDDFCEKVLKNTAIVNPGFPPPEDQKLTVKNQKLIVNAIKDSLLEALAAVTFLTYEPSLLAGGDQSILMPAAIRPPATEYPTFLVQLNLNKIESKFEDLVKTINGAYTLSAQEKVDDPVLRFLVDHQAFEVHVDGPKPVSGVLGILPGVGTPPLCDLASLAYLRWYLHGDATVELKDMKEFFAFCSGGNFTDPNTITPDTAVQARQRGSDILLQRPWGSQDLKLIQMPEAALYLLQPSSSSSGSSASSSSRVALVKVDPADRMTVRLLPDQPWPARLQLVV
jgi:hypothetical protein